MLSSGRFYLLLAIFWLTAITVLLVIPGTAFPSENWMSEIQLDKWAHIILFSILVFLWMKAIWKLYPDKYSFVSLAAVVALISLIYGIGMEIVQHFFVKNRSFELNDIFADLAGSLIGYLLVRGKYFKK